VCNCGYAITCHGNVLFVPVLWPPILGYLQLCKNGVMMMFHIVGHRLENGVSRDFMTTLSEGVNDVSDNLGTDTVVEESRN
jgi:hypothetical protein